MLKLAAAGAAATALVFAVPAGADPPHPLPPQAAQRAVDAIASHGPAEAQAQQAQQMTPAQMSALTGVYRALSFIGLGLVLVAIGWLYQKILFRRQPPPVPAPQA